MNTYTTMPRKLDMNLYDIVFIHNREKACSKRFFTESDCIQYIKKYARYNNWIAGKRADLERNKNKLTGYGKAIAKGNGIEL